MTKRILLSLILWGGVVFSALGYDFAAENASSVTIYYTILSSANKTAAVTYKDSKYNSYSGVVDIPEKVTNPNTSIEFTVTRINASAFRNCTDLTSVTIPSSVIEIGDMAFNGCNNSGFTSLILPENVTTIGTGGTGSSNGRVFYNCTYLESINIPSGVSYIPAYAFYQCSNLSSIEIPSSVTSIGQYAFYNCTALSSANIPSGVTTIQQYAFRGCSALTSIIIPASVTEIQSSAFYMCTNLASVTLLSTTQPSLYNAEVFRRSYTPGDYPTNFYVLKGSGDTYKDADYWKTYSSRISELSALTLANLDLTNSATALIIPSGVTITVTGTATNPTAANIVVKDGGQLAVSSSGIQATFQKGITGYTSTKDSYYLIANPTTTVINPTEVEGMLSNEYDLFYFDESQEGEEWRNYKQGAFNLENGKGYLYANSVTKTLEFAGTVSTGTSSSVTLNLKGTGTYKGFNLVGNPMSVNITSMNIGGSACSYYKLDPTTGVFAVSTDQIIVGEAFMVQTESDGAILNLNPAAKGERGFNNDIIRLEVSNNKYTDVAYLYFGNHLPLTKINHLNDEAPMLYIHNEKADQAVAVMNDRSEVKSVNVNFEAKTTGKYTLSCKTKGEFSYLHVIDRLTGEDVDMLLEDEYEFMASKNDNANRFIVKLEYSENAENSDNSIFAYQNGSDIVVTGEGELQIFDVMGRMVSTQNVNGRETVNVSAQGVYIFRLNGMTQKIVVR